MAGKSIGLGALAVAAALILGGVTPAAAEFFGCSGSRSKVSYSPRTFHSAPARTHVFSAPRFSHDQSSQRTRRDSFAFASDRRTDRW